MKRAFGMLAAITVSGTLLLFSGCGGTSGGANATFCAEGAEDIGIDICVSVTPVSINVNAVEYDCDESGGIDGDERFFFDHFATATITTTKINQNSSFDPYSTGLTITGYRITYYPYKIDSPGIEEYNPLAPQMIQIIGDGSITQQVMLIDFQSIVQFGTDVKSGQFPRVNPPQTYTAVYEFYGEKSGNKFKAKASTTFSIGQFCESR